MSNVATACRHGLPQQRGLARSLAVLEACAPPAAQAFRRTTDIVLRDFRSAEAWRSGLLNRTGAPLEFSCATFSDEIRYTVELGGPETPPAERLARADVLLGELGQPFGPHGIRQRFGGLQTGGDLRWGAWLGVRHGLTGTTFKIYVETPPVPSPLLARFLADYPGDVPPVAGHPPSLVLLGQAQGTDRCEFYFELAERGLSVADLARLLAHVGLAGRQQALMELVSAFEYRSGPGSADALPAAQWGFSYSMRPGGREPVFSLFVLAQDLTGGDGLVRHQLLAATLHRGWTTGCYAALSEPLASQYFRSGYHNMISFVVGKAPLAGIQVSLSPSPQELDD